jgi:hypothetical protein
MLTSALHVRQGVWGKVDRPWHRDGQCRQQKQYGVVNPNGHGPTTPTTSPTTSIAKLVPWQRRGIGYEAAANRTTRLFR